MKDDILYEALSTIDRMASSFLTNHYQQGSLYSTEAALAWMQAREIARVAMAQYRGNKEDK